MLMLTYEEAIGRRQHRGTVGGRGFQFSCSFLKRHMGGGEVDSPLRPRVKSFEECTRLGIWLQNRLQGAVEVCHCRPSLSLCLPTLLLMPFSLCPSVRLSVHLSVDVVFDMLKQEHQTPHSELAHRGRHSHKHTCYRGRPVGGAAVPLLPGPSL